MIPYAIVGTNWISDEFLIASRFADLVLRGVCSRSYEKGKAFADVKVYTSVEELAGAADIEAVYIASPNSCHAAQSEILLRAGKHVICEKPIVTRPEELECLQALAKAMGVIYMEAIMYLGTPARKAVLEALPLLGEIRSAHFDFSQLSKRYDELKGGDIPNVFKPGMGGGAWNDLGIYCVYPALDFFGEPEGVASRMHRIHTGADGAGAAVLEYPDKLVTLTWSKLGQSRGVSQIMGDRGTLTFQSISQFQEVTFHDREGNTRALAEPMEKYEVMQYEAKLFCDYILGRESAVPYEEASQLAMKVAKWMEKVRQ